MKIKEVLRSRGRGVSFEFFPPKQPGSEVFFINVVKELARYDPLYVSVTYGAGGSTRDRTRKALLSIKKAADLNVMSHLTCIGATAESITSILDDYRANGIDNILALRGDAPRDMRDFDISRGEFRYARDLVEFIRKHDDGYFSIGVAAYPEKHPEAPSLEKDIEHLKMKVDAGADFAITQMFFDNAYYYDFMDRALKHAIDIPILPGIMPITDFNRIKEFCSFCNASIPESLEKKMLPVLDSPDGIKKTGIEHVGGQCEDLLRNGVKYLHFYTLNRADAVNEILKPLKDLLK
ncbi:MAG: methylenetetrahydrofolate reductase [NAD(P)H] [Nitrospiraceae bacterium]|nr:methylenetetrahydrofolate reductase [NAD(P)H] [Nitrospiraceae bacterium]